MDLAMVLFFVCCPIWSIVRTLLLVSSKLWDKLGHTTWEKTFGGHVGPIYASMQVSADVQAVTIIIIIINALYENTWTQIHVTHKYKWNKSFYGRKRFS